MNVDKYVYKSRSPSEPFEFFDPYVKEKQNDLDYVRKVGPLEIPLPEASTNWGRKQLFYKLVSMQGKLMKGVSSMEVKEPNKDFVFLGGKRQKRRTKSYRKRKRRTRSKKSRRRTRVKRSKQRRKSRVVRRKNYR